VYAGTCQPSRRRWSDTSNTVYGVSALHVHREDRHLRPVGDELERPECGDLRRQITAMSRNVSMIDVYPARRDE